MVLRRLACFLLAATLAGCERAPEAPGSAASTVAPAAEASTRAPAPAPPVGLPRIVKKGQKHALFVDGAPYLMLCAQTNNSSNHPAALPSVWASVEALGANTLQIPIAWEQVEPSEGKFDFSFVDLLLEQARERGVRLVPLWFGAFKNTSPSYAPSWVELDGARFPRMMRPDGDNHYALSPHTPALLEAETRAFAALLSHLRVVDPRHTVILLQVENEVGVYGLTRDHAPLANEEFERAVPSAQLERGGRAKVPPGANWEAAFGADAEEFFTAHAFATYVGKVAAAARAELDLPMYTNAALRHPTRPSKPGQYATGGPTYNVLDIWKVAAPAIDLLTPDIYLPDSADYFAVLGQYDRADNALFVSETGARRRYARYFFEALGRGALGFSPFGVDDADYVLHPPGAQGVEADAISAFGANFALVRAASREWARLAFESEVWGAARPDDSADRKLDLGRWSAEVSFDEWPFGNRSWSAPGAPGLKDPNDFDNAGVLVARLGDDQFLVTGRNVRIEFQAHPERQAGRRAILLDAERVVWTDGAWVVDRRYNGDQTDYGLNFTERSATFRVRLASYASRNEARSRPVAAEPAEPAD